MTELETMLRTVYTAEYPSGMRGPSPKELMTQAADEIAKLRQWIKQEGERGDTCTYDILRVVCDGCGCARRPAATVADCEGER